MFAGEWVGWGLGNYQSMELPTLVRTTHWECTTYWMSKQVQSNYNAASNCPLGWYVHTIQWE